MSQEVIGELDQSVSYVLKKVHASMRASLDESLRRLDLTVPQYACLELLGRDPGLSSSELARRAFVSRQSMNLVLRRLQDRGLLMRPSQASRGRALPSELTDDGRSVLHQASLMARAVEKELFSPLSPGRQRRLRADLEECLAHAKESV